MTTENDDWKRPDEPLPLLSFPGIPRLAPAVLHPESRSPQPVGCRNEVGPVRVSARPDRHQFD